MQEISEQLSANIAKVEEFYKDCSDIKKQTMWLGEAGKSVACYVVCIEVAVQNTSLGETAFGKVLQSIKGWCYLSKEERKERIDSNAMGVSDITYYEYLEDAMQGLLVGDVILFIDGYGQALKLADKGYPGRTISDSDSEKVVRGSNEAFTDSVKTNAAMIRKRLRSPKLKNKAKTIGVRSNTLVNLLYVDGIVEEDLINRIEKKLETWEIDGILDTGMLEQLMEEKWYSPFPQYQTTQRPDRAVIALLEGKAVLMCDNSPIALIMPVDFNSFLRTSDDYYNRTEAVALARILRYSASFFAMTLPGLYLSMTNFHTQILPTTLLLSFQEARMGVPFPAAVEVLLMELSFELLREAGVRLPGAMGSTIGIVGGLIIGQAAVDANIVSPIVVILVAFTALCSFAIPNEEFAYAFRILKFFLIFLCAWLGYFGFLLGMMAIISHLAGLSSFGQPYMMPFVAREEDPCGPLQDGVIRSPLRFLRKRPYSANAANRRKLREKTMDNNRKSGANNEDNCRQQ